jgi:hypothetical protein
MSVSPVYKMASQVASKYMLNVAVYPYGTLGLGQAIDCHVFSLRQHMALSKLLID